LTRKLGLWAVRPNQVWAADITYFAMRQGFLYLVAIMDWATRRVLSWVPKRRARSSPGSASPNLQYRSGGTIHQR
jgi:transposase InsO family protein